MCLDCAGLTTENSAICACFLIRHGDSVVLVTLVAILLSIIVNIEWEISKLAVSVNFSNRVTVPLGFLFGGWSTKAVIVFVVVGGIIRASSVMTDWGIAVVSLEAVLTCIVNCRKIMWLCVVSTTTLLFLIKYNPIIGPIILFITTKCSTTMLSTISISSMVAANGFSNWSLATSIWKLGGSSILRILCGAFLFYCFVLRNYTDVCSRNHQSIYR